MTQAEKRTKKAAPPRIISIFRSPLIFIYSLIIAPLYYKFITVRLRLCYILKDVYLLMHHVRAQTDAGLLCIVEA